MANIFLAAPGNIPEPPAPPKWTSNTLSWSHPNVLDADGDRVLWNLCSGNSGVFLEEGVRGFSMPPVIHHRSQSPAVAGSRWRSSVVDNREMFWPIHVYSNEDSQAWIEIDRMFWRSMDPLVPGTFTVQQPSGESRSIDLRFVDDGSHAFMIAPELRGWTKYGVTLLAEQPFWLGQTLQTSWQNEEDPKTFFGDGAGATPFYINSSHNMASATVTNPGDVITYPIWKIEGPSTAASVGVGDRAVTVPFTVADGDYVVLDSDPRKQTAVDQDGVDVTAQLGSVKWAGIPTGQGVPINISMTGAGKITMQIQPKFYRAW